MTPVGTVFFGLRNTHFQTMPNSFPAVSGGMSSVLRYLPSRNWGDVLTKDATETERGTSVMVSVMAALVEVNIHYTV